MSNNTLLQFPNGDESTLDEWAETEEVSKPEAKPANLGRERDRFLLWEVRRGLSYTINRIVEHQPIRP